MAVNIQDELIELVTQELVALLKKEYNLDIETALYKLYSSKTFEKLQDKETGLYRESGGYILSYLKEEMNG